MCYATMKSLTDVVAITNGFSNQSILIIQAIGNDPISICPMLCYQSQIQYELQELLYFLLYKSVSLISANLFCVVRGVPRNINFKFQKCNNSFIAIFHTPSPEQLF